MITLLTDFGTADYFVPAVRGVILRINPEARIVDLTHDIAPHDIAGGAFTLWACYREVPPGTIHLAVVDPGVGSARRPLIIETPTARFVGPDNGIFSRIIDAEPEVEIFRIDPTVERIGGGQPLRSATFHGRDIFAPVAAWLSRGLAPRELGVPVTDPVRLPEVRPWFDAQTGRLIGQVIYLDRYGNCVTNLDHVALPWPVPAGSRLMVAGVEIRQFVSHFGEAVDREAAFAYPGSAGYWEIGCWCAPAATRLGIRVGTVVEVALAAAPEWCSPQSF